jgi:hypothetical protein
MWFPGSFLLGDVDFGTSFAWEFGVDLLGAVKQGFSTMSNLLFAKNF